MMTGQETKGQSDVGEASKATQCGCQHLAKFTGGSHFITCHQCSVGDFSPAICERLILQYQNKNPYFLKKKKRGETSLLERF